MVTHPIGDDLLMGYATGRLPAAYDLLIAAAVSLDDDARVRLSAFEAMGGALLARGEVAPLRGDSYEHVLGRIRNAPPEETVPEARKVPARAPILPQPLRAVAGGDLADVAWDAPGRDGPAGERAVLAGDAFGRAVLAQVPEGAAPPVRSMEAALILSGALYLGPARFARGDLVHPVPSGVAMAADAAGGCVALLVTDAETPAREWLPRLARGLGARLGRT